MTSHNLLEPSVTRVCLKCSIAIMSIASDSVYSRSFSTCLLKLNGGGVWFNLEHNDVNQSIERDFV